MEKSVAAKLELNVVAIVIGALIFIGIRFWSETIFELSDTVHKHGGRDNKWKRMLVSTTLISLFVIFLIILIYTYMKSRRYW
jgi:hypothetical protein